MRQRANQEAIQKQAAQLIITLAGSVTNYCFRIVLTSN